MTERLTGTLERSQENDRTSALGQLGPFSVVCLSDLNWDEHWSSEQQIMSRLSERCPVLYVERPVSILSFFTGVSDTSVLRQWTRWLGGGLRRERPNLTIVTPSPVLPFRYNRFVNRINMWLLRRSVKHAMKKAGIKSFALWVYSPDAGSVVGTLGESYSLYYCADDWAASGQWWNSSHNVRARERELASKADLIIGTSTKIVRRWEQSHQNTMLMTNGADVDSFKAAREPALSAPEDVKHIPAPRIGYVGCIDARFDSALYVALAEKHPDWQFVIVGPVSVTNPNVVRLNEMRNVHFLGSRDRGDLPAYLKWFDVCTIPYVLNKLSESIFPLKLFEYLSAGRPVVSTALPELLPYTDYVHVTGTQKDFEDAIDQSLREPLPAPSDGFLHQNSWEAKTELLWETIQRAMSQ